MWKLSQGSCGERIFRDTDDLRSFGKCLEDTREDRGRCKIPDAVREHCYVKDGFIGPRGQEVNGVLLNKGDSRTETRGRKVFLRLPERIWCT